MGILGLYGTLLVYIICTGIGLAIFYYILKNAIKNGIVEADEIIRDAKEAEEEEDHEESNK